MCHCGTENYHWQVHPIGESDQLHLGWVVESLLSAPDGAFLSFLVQEELELIYTGSGVF